MSCRRETLIILSLSLAIFSGTIPILPQLALAAVSDTGVGTWEGGSSNPHDWVHFNPKKFEPAYRLVPGAYVAVPRARFYQKGAPPTFPHDPSRSNVIYGRGPKSLPTAIYAKAFDILQFDNKLFQAPAAGESKQITVNGLSMTIYGTTWYTPLPDNRFVANPVQITPFDPTRVFYKNKETWPAIIYGEPGQEIVIANQRLRIPAAGESKFVTFAADGRLKDSAIDNKKSDKANDSAKEGSDAGKHSSSSSSGNASTGGGATGTSSSGSGVTSSSGSGSSSASAKASAEKLAADKVAADKAAVDKAAADKLAADKVAADKAAADKAAADKAVADKAAADKVAAEKLAAANTTSSANSGSSTGSGASAGTSSGASAGTSSGASVGTSSGSSTGTSSGASAGTSSGSSAGTSSGSSAGTGSGSSSGTSSSGSSAGTGSGSSSGTSSGSSAGTGGGSSAGTGTGGGSGAAGGEGTGEQILAYGVDAVPVTDKSTVKEDGGFLGIGSKQVFSIPIDRKKSCFYYDSTHRPASTVDVTGTITGDINVLNQVLPVNSLIKAVCELGITAGPKWNIQARTLTVPEFKRDSDKSTAYPHLGPVIIAYKGTASEKWTDSNSFKLNNPGLFAAPDSGVRYQQAGGPVGSAGGDSMLGGYTDTSSGTQLKSANDQAMDLGKLLLKIVGQ